MASQNTRVRRKLDERRRKREEEHERRMKELVAYKEGKPTEGIVLPTPEEVALVSTRT